MQRADTPSNEDYPRQFRRPGRRVTSIIVAAAVVMLLVLFRAKLQPLELPSLLLVVVFAALFVVIFFHTRFLLRARDQHVQSDERFQQMANNIQEIFWMIDAGTKRALYVNEAYETITGYSCQSLRENPLSYQDLIHPEDRVRVLAKLDEATGTGRFHERFRITCARGEIRWVSLQGFPVRDTGGKIARLVGTVQEITAQKQAEEQVARNLTLAESARAEAEALRKATLGLTQDLRMDYVLDALLESLAEIVPYACAGVFLVEADTRLFLAREKLHHQTGGEVSHYPFTLDAADLPLLHHVLAKPSSILLTDTSATKDWHRFTDHPDIRSWLCVPLVASQQALGVLSIGHSEIHRFTPEHLRRAQLLAIPAAAAIQNARLFECAEIYGAELEKRVEDLRRTQRALEYSEQNRRTSEDKFQKVFRSSPISFSITTLQDGRFLDVNAAFERRYGYCRAEVIGHTVHELGIWEDSSDRTRMVTQLQRGGPIRNVITRLRTKSGEIKLTAYSADRIDFEGQSCILAVSEDVPSFEPRRSN
ncbi:MAG TPA: PAS domain S-box protein [Terriglobales bacterium]|nr:PAS domain S-box protein [Terriglobales bacterium]